jgi:uncharacterized protein
MIPSDTEDVLTALRGRHRPPVADALRRALLVFGLSLTWSSLALLIASLTWEGFPTWLRAVVAPLLIVGYVGSFVIPGILAYREATTIYVFDHTGLKARHGWPFQGWSVARTDILEARVVHGMFQWSLDLTLPNGRERRLALSPSMQRALAIGLGVMLALSQSLPAIADGFVDQLVAAALAQTTRTVRYDGSYHRIPYPGGDVPDDVGVCTDVVVRAYRAVGVDLQQRVHEDMTRAFADYPTAWGLRRPDANIDHRRVPNLQAYFRRRGAGVAVTSDPRDYAAGDIATWMLPGNLPHIGIVTDRRSPDGQRPLILHNIGNGPGLEDMLLQFPITGHYRYRGD